MAATLATVLGALVGILLTATLLRSREQRSALRRLEAWEAQEAARIGDAARRRSEAVVRGQITEQVALFAPEAPWDPADARFLGRPIDFVVFDGLADVRAGRADRLREIVFVDVKTGQAGLSKLERRIRDAVAEGRVQVMTTTEATVPAAMISPASQAQVTAPDQGRGT